MANAMMQFTVSSTGTTEIGRSMNFARDPRVKFAAASGALLFGLLLGRPARAEVPLVHTDTWDVYTTGRIDAFFSFGYGDANPTEMPNENIPRGAGLDVGNDSLAPSNCTDTSGMRCPPPKFLSMRVRSGFIPNVLAIGARRKLNEDTRVSAYFALWATIDTEAQRKETQVYADARETWLKIESQRFGTLTAGKALDLFSRGATENDFLYMHGYSLGFPGNINTFGPTNGMIGFGVLAAFFSAGVMYTTPSLGGIQLSAGVYDPTTLPGFYESTRDPRWEAELTYDALIGPAKLHLFANGGYQRFYRPASDISASGAGAGYGGRVEFGPLHVGVAGHYGRGLGLQYAFQVGDVNVAPDLTHLRYFDGYSVFAQYVLGSSFDFNAGWGISRVFPLDSDKAPGANISLPQQWAVSAAIVYHAADFLHFDLDYLHALTTWSLGEQQAMDFINTGAVVTW
jgi:hypothetical protein